ncbi:hypothetical protein Tco_0074156 [Tanacetum coccineum]
MKEDETIDTFTGKLTTLVNKAASLGHTMEDETLVGKLLNDVPYRYLQIVASIEQYSDLDEMTLEEAIGRLKTYEERIKYKKGKQVDNQEKLMFTRHENKGNSIVLSNGASKHMTGVREHFQELDEKVKGKVKDLRMGSIHKIKRKSVPTKALEDITPYEAIKQRKPNLENLRVFGCIAYAKICVSRDVKFKENETWDWKEYMSEHINDEPEWTDFKIGIVEDQK